MSRVVSAVAITAMIVLAVPAIRHWRERPPAPDPPAQPLRSTWNVPGGLDAGAGADYSFGLSLAADGRQLLYPAAKAGVASLWLHDLSSGATRELPGTSGAAMPFWSADLAKIGFFAEGKIRVLELASGTASDVADAPSGRGASWSRDGVLVFAPSPNSGLMRRDASGSIAALTELESGETAHTWPSFLPDGRHVIFLVTASQSSRSGIWIASLDDSSARKRLFSADAQAIVPTQNLKTLRPQDLVILYLNDLALMAQPIDASTLDPSGRAAVVGLQAGRGPLGQIFATATEDVLIYGAPGTTLRELRWLARDGTPAGSTNEPIDAWDLRIAPDGTRIVVTEIDPQLRTLDVFIRTGSQPAPTRLSLSTDVDESGVWSPDGLRIAWAGQRRKVMLRGAGAVLPEQTIATFDSPVQVWDWSRDGRSLLIGRKNNDTGDDLWIQPPVERAAAQPYSTAAFDQAYGAFSPDGRAIAYASNESGQFDIYVDAFPKPGTRVRVTTAGGTEPRWSNDGRELFFRRGSAIHSVRFATDREIETITQLFDLGKTVRSYDVSRDGRFLVNLAATSQAAAPPTIVANWLPRTGHGGSEARSKHN
jgi:eukaryotic-like serine/threonine-protein kinase